MSYFRLPSYEAVGCEDCYQGTKEEPCWGAVRCIDDYEDEYGYVHKTWRCEGHEYFPTYEASRHAKDEVEPREYDY